MSTSTYEKPLPRRGELEQPFWDACARSELRLQQCTACGHWRFPPSPLCPRCLSDSYEWNLTSGAGRVWSWIVMHQKYFASFADDLPYNVVLIELEEGPRMMSTLKGFDPARVRCDAPVKVVFEPAGEVYLPAFVLADDVT